MAVDPSSSPFWPADSPAATTHITLLQGIITRLANNSASCKTWCLTLVAALLSLSGAAHLPQMVTARVGCHKSLRFARRFHAISVT
jgi:hypothetical protein